jgi:hypothetical protein
MRGDCMPRGKKLEDLAILRMALVGYQIEKQKIADKIAEIEAQLSGKSSAPEAPSPTAGRKKRTLSAAARARIAAAQKKRWAEHRKRLAAGK